MVHHKNYFGKKMNAIMAESGVLNVKFKNFMENNVQAD